MVISTEEYCRARADYLRLNKTHEELINMVIDLEKRESGLLKRLDRLTSGHGRIN